MPSIDNGRRSALAFQYKDGMSSEAKVRFGDLKDRIFLDALEIPKPSRLLQPPPGMSADTSYPFAADPSMYKFDHALRGSCFEAGSCLSTFASLAQSQKQAMQGPIFTAEVNSVYLPGKDKWIHYDNTTDVLFLRFGLPGQVSDSKHDDEVMQRAFNSGISDLLSGDWSAEMAETLRNARRIAIDIAETGLATSQEDFIYQEVAFLSCCIQQSLEVLYLVDHTIGRSQEDMDGQPPTRATCNSEEELSETSNISSSVLCGREPDVIHGVGLTYRELIDRDPSRWEEKHPTFSLLTMFDELVRSQQGDGSCFQGVRVLAR
jgi:hypothetical protein